MRVPRSARIAIATAAVVTVFAAPAPATAAKLKTAKDYTGTMSFHSTTSDTSTGFSRTEDVQVTGVKLKRYAVKTILHLPTALYKFTAGTVTWHVQQSGDCSYVLDKTLPVTLLHRLPTSLPALMLSRPPLVKAPRFAVQGGNVVSDRFPIGQTCADGTSDVPMAAFVFYGNGKTGTRARVKGNNLTNSSDGPESNSSEWRWDLTGH